MAKRTANTKKNTQTKETGHSVGFTMTGVLKEVYVGKKYAYAKIRVDKSNGYYDNFSVAFDLDTDFPEDGATVHACGTFTLYQEKPAFTGTIIEEVEPF